MGRRAGTVIQDHVPSAAMSLDDTFGSFPGRPQHPDMTALSEILLAHDAKSYEMGAEGAFAEFLGGFVDPESAVYVASQRAMRSLAGLSPRASQHELMAALAASWLDAFMVGYRFHEQDGQAPPGVT